MLILPAIDLMDGGCVRLRQGDFARATQYSTDPLKRAFEFANAGAEWIHIVDLDGARSGKTVNRGVIEQIATSAELKVQTGGGVRSPDDIAALLSAGVTRVVAGTLIVRQPEAAAALVEAFGADRLVAAVDVRPSEDGYRVAVRGWQEESAVGPEALIDGLSAAGIRHYLVTDISRDGMLDGPNLALYRRLATQYPGLAIQASGGVSSADDLNQIAQTGAAAAIVGRAIYEGQVTLTELFDGR